MTVKIHSEKPVSQPEQARGGPARSNESKTQTPAPAAKDKVVLSSMASEAAQLKQPASVQDAERAAKVAELREQVASGSYQPDLEKVAESLLKYIMKDE